MESFRETNAKIMRIIRNIKSESFYLRICMSYLCGRKGEIGENKIINNRCGRV